MTEKKRKRRKSRPNAFERASEAVLALDTGWWTALLEADLGGVEISEPEYIQLGDQRTGIGGMIFERRTVTFPRKRRKKAAQAIITRPIVTRFSALPLDVLERIARDILALSDAQWRQANIDKVIETAREFTEEARLEMAQDILGPEATTEDLQRFADQLRMPEALMEGGDAAAQFFDESISTVRIGGEDGSEQIMDKPAPPPGRTALLTGEWDFYTPEEVEDHGGPESDSGYAFRIVRLCSAIRAEPAVAVDLAVQLGAVTREWEIWREQAEFIDAGRAHFAQQSRLARSRDTRPWMTQVRQDLAGGKIGDNIAQYARDFTRKRRDLQPPSTERIRNFVSELRSADSD